MEKKRNTGKDNRRREIKCGEREMFNWFPSYCFSP